MKSALSFYEKNPHLQGALIGIDLKRAFDSISHKYLFNCLKHIGIPSMLIDTLHNIYQSSFSQVNINGFMTPRFHIQRGVRQGCPLSMHLFTLVMETLVCAVNRAVSGLKVQNVTLVCRAYADDIFILLSNPIQFDPLLSAFETFQAACGTSINWSKSSYLPLGTWVTPLPPLTQVSQIKILGIQFHQKMCTSVQINWSKATNRIHTLTIQCLSRRLSLQQRVWYTNIYLLSSLWFLAKVFPPRKMDTQQVEKYIGYFIWKDFPYRVARQQLRLPLNKGGLNLVDVEAKCHTLMMKHCDNLIVGSNQDEFEVALNNHLLINTAPQLQNFPAYIRPVFVKREQLLTTNGFSSLPPTRTLYKMLIEMNNITPHIVSSRPTIDWYKTWTNIHRSPMSSEWRSSLYLIINDAIGYGEKLLRHGRVNSDQCNYCNCHQVETLRHKFIECPTINRLWSWVHDCLKNKIKLPARCLLRITNLSVDFLCDRKTRNAAMWLVAGYFHFILVKSDNKCLTNLLTLLRTSRWQLSQEKMLPSLFGNKLYFF